MPPRPQRCRRCRAVCRFRRGSSCPSKALGNRLICAMMRGGEEARPMQLGAMQDFPLRIMRILDHAEREHGTREIVAARADGTVVRTNWTRLTQDARRTGQALERLGVRPGDRVATLAMNHDRHLATWFGVVGAGAILHTVNPRLFDDQLIYIITHAEDRVLLYDSSFEPLVERLKPQLPTVEHYVSFDTDFDSWLSA